MQLHPYVTQLQDQLTAAAAIGDERTRETAGALVAAAEPAMRLAVLNAVYAAAAEITAALLDSPGAPAVGIGLDGDELRVDVRTTEAAEPPPPPTDDGDASARISLRLSEALKSDVEAAARRESVSLNTWLVRAASLALSPGAHFASLGGESRKQATNAHRITGWING